MWKNPESKPAQSTCQTNDDKVLDNILAEGDSYEVLKATSISSGTHFQFKSEKSWTLADTPPNSRFHLQIPLMSEKFVTIPFSDRRDVYSKYFVQDDVVYKSPVSDKSSNDVRFLSENLDEFDREMSQFAPVPTMSEKDDELSTIPKTIQAEKDMYKDSNMSESHQNISAEKSNQETNLKKSNKPELEDWLDSILND